jgi:uncharacterized protein (TIGR00725 family)
MAKDIQDFGDFKYSICVSGAAAGATVEASKELARRIGQEVARLGHTVTTGATVGLPYFAALGAREFGGMSIGFSPASSLREHVRKYRLPNDVFDFINFTGMNYVGRDLYLVQSSDAVITVGGRFGSLHEFTSALEAHKTCGVLLGSGGTADQIDKLLDVLDPGMRDRVIFDDNPERLVKRVIAILDERYNDIIEDIKKHDNHWYLHQTPHPRKG